MTDEERDLLISKSNEIYLLRTELAKHTALEDKLLARRDAYKLAAMNGILASPHFIDDLEGRHLDWLVKRVNGVADAMLKEPEITQKSE